jgi:hypothetical protein
MQVHTIDIAGDVVNTTWRQGRRAGGLPLLRGTAVASLTFRARVLALDYERSKTAPIWARRRVAAPSLRTTGIHRTLPSTAPYAPSGLRRQNYTCARYVSRDRYFLFPLTVFIPSPLNYITLGWCEQEKGRCFIRKTVEGSSSLFGCGQSTAIWTLDSALCFMFLL